jgi:hypothetical protein
MLRKRAKKRAAEPVSFAALHEAAQRDRLAAQEFLYPSRDWIALPVDPANQPPALPITPPARPTGGLMRS